LHLLLIPILLGLFFILLMSLLLILERYCYYEILYLVNLGNKLVKAAVSFLGGMMMTVGGLLGVVLTLTLRTLVCVALSPSRHYDLLFLLQQFRRSLIRSLSIQNYLAITICNISFHL
jgi:hypothetical protein